MINTLTFIFYFQFFPHVYSYLNKYVWILLEYFSLRDYACEVTKSALKT